MVYKLRASIQKKLIQAAASGENIIHKLTNGKLAGNSFYTAVDVPFVGSKVRIIKETEDSVYIAKFNDDGSYDNSDFRILCTTDLHIDVDYTMNNRTIDYVCQHIADLKPDLVIFTGDIVLSKYQRIDAVQFARVMEKLGVYWAYAFGNHEARAEKEYFKYIFYKCMVDYPHCLSRFGDPSLYGYGNYFINVLDGENSLRQSLVVFDSGRDICEPHRTNDNIPEEYDGYDYVKPSQIKWFTDNINELKNKYGICKSMIFQHIPIPEYKCFFDHVKDDQFELKQGAKVICGEQHENIGCSQYNSGLFDAMKANGTQAMFCGHDHANDFCGVVDGIHLAYNKTGGLNCFQLYENYRMKADEKTWHFGINYIDIHKDGSFDLAYRSFADYNY